MLHSRFIYRQIVHSRKQVALFVACVTLSIVTLVAINGFSESINRSLMRDARKLHGGDIIIRSAHPFSTGLTSAIEAFVRSGQIQAAAVFEFYAMARNPLTEKSLLARLKIVPPNYPFYGEVALASGRKLKQVLQPGTIVIEENLGLRLQIDLGQRLRIGNSELAVVDYVVSEPDRPADFFSLGPRVFAGTADLPAMELMRKGSRIRNPYLLKVAAPDRMAVIAADLKKEALAAQERVQTFTEAESRIKRFFDNFLFFLSLIGIFTLLLAGIGIYSTLIAFIKEQETTIAIIKTLGATYAYIRLHFTVILTLLGTLGTMAGIAAGIGLQHFLGFLFKGLLPADLKLTISPLAVCEGGLLGILVVALFSFLPIYRLKAFKPVAIFSRQVRVVPKGPEYIFSMAIIGLFFAVMVFWQIPDGRIGFYFLLEVIGLIVIVTVLAQLVLIVLKKMPAKSLVARQALKALFRPGNSTRTIIVSFAAALTVIFSIYLIEENLDRTYVASYPADAPNMFMVDIQTDQVDAVSAALGNRSVFYPIVRARLTHINDRPVNRRKERKRRTGDNLARPFSLTYRSNLLADENLLAGPGLFNPSWQEPQVSVLDMVVDMHPMAIGDRIAFNIQGVPLSARISSIRRRTANSLKPYFYFVFPPDILKAAPQTHFTALRVAPDEIAPLQNRITQKFPNVSMIDMTATVSYFARTMGKLSNIIRFFTVFSTIAGVFILISAILATRAARIREAVYYKILGSRSRFVVGVFTLEILLLGLVSSLLALVLSQIGSYLTCRYFLEISYHALPLASLIMVGLTLILVVGVGGWASRPILRARPAVYLREHGHE